MGQLHFFKVCFCISASNYVGIYIFYKPVGKVLHPGILARPLAIDVNTV